MVISYPPFSLTVSIDEKIERAEGAVSRAKEKYDAALEELKRLHEKKEELQRAGSLSKETCFFI